MSWPLSLATFNLQNLGVPSPPGKLHRLARLLVEGLEAPAILALQELAAPAGSGPTVPATETAQGLIDAVQEAGGPEYRYLEIAPQKDSEGGQPGCNIRVGFLFNPERAHFQQRAPLANCPGHPQQVRVYHGQVPHLAPNPGRIEPTHGAFCGDPAQHWLPSRRVLCGEFQIAGQALYLLNCHLKSMRTRGRREAAQARKQRHAQASRVAHFVQTLLSCQPEARVVVLGDFNDGINSRTLEILREPGLSNALAQLPPGLRHTSTHGGVLQTLDHVLVSPGLAIHQVRVLHQHRLSIDPPVSDHDPVLAILGEGTITYRDPQTHSRLCGIA